MFDADLTAAEILDRYVPVPAVVGDWDAVMGDVGPARRRRRWPRPVGALAAAVLAVGLVVLLAPSRHGSDSVVDRALAALGDGPVLHVVLRQTTPAWVTVDLATGSRHEAFQETETWSDPNRGSHWILRVDGRVLNDSVARDPITDPLLTAFVQGYRSALEDGRARAAGNGEVDGKKVRWLEFRTDSGGDEEVAVDADTFEPLAIRWTRPDVPGPLTQVLRIEAEPAGSGDFTAPAHEPYPSRGDVIRSERIDRAQAQGSFPSRALWPGPTISGLDLASVQSDDWRDVYPDGEHAPVEGKGLRLAYSAPGAEHPSLRLSESSYPTYTYGWEPFEPAPAPGTVRVVSFPAASGSAGGGISQGEVLVNGTFVVIQGESEQIVVDAAKALEPIG